MSDAINITATVSVGVDELAWRFSRSSGPGGQSVNTSNTRVELSFDIARSPSLPDHLRERLLERLQHRLADGVLTIDSSEFRSQLRNREAALDRLVETLTKAAAPPPPRRRRTTPSRAAQAKRVDAKRQRGETKRLRRSIGDD